MEQGIVLYREGEHTLRIDFDPNEYEFARETCEIVIDGMKQDRIIAAANLANLDDGICWLYDNAASVDLESSRNGGDLNRAGLIFSDFLRRHATA